jgi:1-acylglycerone phosphate reductase
VSVLSIVTGAVKSNGQTYFEDFKLPENSMYTSIEQIIGDRARGFDGAKRQPTREYAEAVVDAILAGKSAKVWKGANAGGVKFATTWLPQSMMVSEEESQTWESANVLIGHICKQRDRS